MKKTTAMVAGAALVLLAGLGIASDAQAMQKKNRKSSTVTIVNRADWDIYELYLSPVGDDEWGPDQLGEDVIGKGDSFELHSIPCDDYDVMIVDEDGDECIIEEVDLCMDDEEWVIKNKDLLACQGY